MDQNKSISYIRSLLEVMLKRKAADLFITAGAPPSIKKYNEIEHLSNQVLSGSAARTLIRAIMNEYQLNKFDQDLECNFSINIEDLSRFRVCAFMQKDCYGMVLRHIPRKIPSMESLQLPEVFKSLAMTKRGLVLVVGATGSGKSTTLASMIDYRNQNSKDHIVTIEDPIEFVHDHKQSIITQREVGVDTLNYEAALKNTLRQSPDVILLGEIRDAENHGLCHDLCRNRAFVHLNPSLK